MVISCWGGGMLTVDGLALGSTIILSPAALAGFLSLVVSLGEERNERM